MKRQAQLPKEEAVKNRLKELRLAHGLSQDDLATEARIRQATISRIEQGGDPSPRTVRVLSKFFGVPGTFLMGLDVPTEAVREKEPA
jgi:transcriptional regulator with XRE-family HTH domain